MKSLNMSKYVLEWDLYYIPDEKDKVSSVNEDLNSNLLFQLGVFSIQANNKGLEEASKNFIKEMHDIMFKYKDVGAYDSEPRSQLFDVMMSFSKDIGFAHIIGNRFDDYITGTKYKTSHDMC